MSHGQDGNGNRRPASIGSSASRLLALLDGSHYQAAALARRSRHRPIVDRMPGRSIPARAPRWRCRTRRSTSPAFAPIAITSARCSGMAPAAAVRRAHRSDRCLPGRPGLLALVVVEPPWQPVEERKTIANQHSIDKVYDDFYQRYAAEVCVECLYRPATTAIRRDPGPQNSAP